MVSRTPEQAITIIPDTRQRLLATSTVVAVLAKDVHVTAFSSGLEFVRILEAFGYARVYHRSRCRRLLHQ